MKEKRSCRLCHKQDERLLKYEVRHYAHTDCYLTAYGFEALLELPVGSLMRVRVGALTAAQLDQVTAKVDASATAWDRAFHSLNEAKP